MYRVDFTAATATKCILTIRFPLVDVLLHLEVQVSSTEMGAANEKLLHIVLSKRQRIKTSRHLVDQKGYEINLYTDKQPRTTLTNYRRWYAEVHISQYAYFTPLHVIILSVTVTAISAMV